MNLLKALHLVVGSGTTAVNEPVIIVNDFKAAEYLSMIINSEGGTGSIYGPFEFKREGSDEYIKCWEVSLAELQSDDKPKELAVIPL